MNKQNPDPKPPWKKPPGMLTEEELEEELQQAEKELDAGLGIPWEELRKKFGLE